MTKIGYRGLNQLGPPPRAKNHGLRYAHKLKVKPPKNADDWAILNDFRQRHGITGPLTDNAQELRLMVGLERGRQRLRKKPTLAKINMKVVDE